MYNGVRQNKAVREAGRERWRRNVESERRETKRKTRNAAKKAGSARKADGSEGWVCNGVKAEKYDKDWKNDRARGCKATNEVRDEEAGIDGIGEIDGCRSIRDDDGTRRERAGRRVDGSALGARRARDSPLVTVCIGVCMTGCKQSEVMKPSS